MTSMREKAEYISDEDAKAKEERAAKLRETIIAHVDQFCPDLKGKTREHMIDQMILVVELSYDFVATAQGLRYMFGMTFYDQIDNFIDGCLLGQDDALFPQGRPTNDAAPPSIVMNAPEAMQ